MLFHVTEDICIKEYVMRVIAYDKLLLLLVLKSF